MKFILVLMLWTPTGSVYQHAYEEAPYISYNDCYANANAHVWEMLDQYSLDLNDLQGIRQGCLSEAQYNRWAELNGT